MRLSKIKVFGVFLSPRAFLKSLITLLKDMLALLAAEDMEDIDSYVLPSLLVDATSLLEDPITKFDLNNSADPPSLVRFGFTIL